MRIVRRNSDPNKKSTAPRRGEPWHAFSEETLYHKLRTGPEGLSGEEADERLREYGQNVLPGKRPPSLLRVVWHQFASPLIYILLIAGSVSLVIGDLKDAIFIFGVILLNTTIGAGQEWRAEQSAHALQSMLKIKARVRRSGDVRQIPAEELVPGDIILIEPGDKVAADIRLKSALNLSIDEAFLTGESLPVQKNTAVLSEETLLSERANTAYAGAIVTTGRGTGLVVATGSHTEVGKIARSITEKEAAEPPLVIRMKRFARQISIVVLGFAIILGLLSGARGIPFREVFFVMVAMSVSAIPEGLPVAMTVALSLATSRMARRKVIARKLVAVESLGSCTAIASDKTGTLTVNQQTAKVVVFPDGTRVGISGQGYNGKGRAYIENGETLGEPLLSSMSDLARAGVLCNEGSLSVENGAWRHSGDAMDVALLALGRKLGIDSEAAQRRVNIVGEIPFESEKRFAVVAYRGTRIDHKVSLAAKGAVETILPFCSRMRTGSGDKPLDVAGLQLRAEELAEGGYRVLAIATGRLSGDKHPEKIDESDLTDLVLLGLVGFIDPLRPEVKEAVSLAHKAGVKVVMVTGDHPATALAIARELGVAGSPEQVITGAGIEAAVSADTPEFHEQLRHIRVFARVTPQQKVDIVDSLMELGDFVAVTGDGVNDAPALSRSNIGVAMGSGTDVAKDAAQIIVTDDNFASIVNGIEEGRYAYANVRKVTLLLISTGFAELVLIGATVVLNMPAPFLAVQILWLNLVTNGIQDVALAFEAGEKGIMKLGPRRPTEGIFNRKMIEQVLVGGLTMGLVCLAVWIYLINSGVEAPSARNALLALLILMQSYHVLNSRSEYRSAFRIPIRNNRILIVGMVVAFSIHVIATQAPPMQSLLRISPLSPLQWLFLAVIASSVMVAMEIYKRVAAMRAR